MSTDESSSIQTERLIVRRPCLEDVPEVNAAVCESIESLKPWMEWAQTPPPLEETRTRIAAALDTFSLKTDLIFCAFLRESGEFVGGFGLHQINAGVPSYSIGYWCRATRQRCGYTTEAVHALVEFAFKELGAKRVELCCDPLNTASIAVARKAEFQLEGELLNESVRPNGEVRNTLVFSRIPVAI